MSKIETVGPLSRLLRSRDKRARDCCAAKKRKKFTPSHLCPEGSGRRLNRSVAFVSSRLFDLPSFILFKMRSMAPIAMLTSVIIMPCPIAIWTSFDGAMPLSPCVPSWNNTSISLEPDISPEPLTIDHIATGSIDLPKNDARSDYTNYTNR